MVAFGRFNKLWEACCMLSPVKLSTVNNYTSNSGAVTSNPLGGAVYNNVGAVLNGTAIIAAGAECIVNLDSTLI